MAIICLQILKVPTAAKVLAKVVKKVKGQKSEVKAKDQKSSAKVKGQKKSEAKTKDVTKETTATEGKKVARQPKTAKGERNHGNQKFYGFSSRQM